MAITGYYFGTEDGGESKFGTHKKILVLNIKYINAVLISHVICHVASFFLESKVCLPSVRNANSFIQTK